MCRMSSMNVENRGDFGVTAEKALLRLQLMSWHELTSREFNKNEK